VGAESELLRLRPGAREDALAIEHHVLAIADHLLAVDEDLGDVARVAAVDEA
jgi:hypothetical protein